MTANWWSPDNEQALPPTECSPITNSDPGTETYLPRLMWSLRVLCPFFGVFLIKEYEPNWVNHWWITRSIFSWIEQFSSPGLDKSWELWFRLKMILNPVTILGISWVVAPVRAGCRDPAWGREGAWREGGEQPGEARGVSQAQVQEAGLQLQVRVQGGVHREAGLQDHLPIQVPGIQETGRDLESVCPYFLTFSLCQFQECRNVWQNQCRGKNGRRRAKRSPRRQPYWLDKNNIEVIYNAQDFPIAPSDIPFADQGADAGSTYTFASPPKSRSCWKKVRKCEWKTYRTSCGNRPTTTCSGKTIQDCKKRCKNRWYCDTCPAGTGGGATTAKPVGPGQTTPRPRPTPRPPGPPAPPPQGTFIIGPPGTPVGADTGISVIDARGGKGRQKRRRPWAQYLLVAISLDLGKTSDHFQIFDLTKS